MSPQIVRRHDRKVKVKKCDLLDHLKKNRDAHIAQYEEAIDGYLEAGREKLQEAFQKAKEQLDKGYEKAKETLEAFDEENPTASPNQIALMDGVSVELTVPTNFTEEYDSAIKLFEWERSEQIELTFSEFRNYVEDEWDWSKHFDDIHETYSKARKIR